MKKNPEIELDLITELLEQDSGAYTIFIGDKFYTFVYDRNDGITVKDGRNIWEIEL
jgi:hypothetical protein